MKKSQKSKEKQNKKKTINKYWKKVYKIIQNPKMEKESKRKSRII